jgi:hypothetical protein
MVRKQTQKLNYFCMEYHIQQITKLQDVITQTMFFTVIFHAELLEQKKADFHSSQHLVGKKFTQP